MIFNRVGVEEETELQTFDSGRTVSGLSSYHTYSIKACYDNLLTEKWKYLLVCEVVYRFLSP